MPSVRVVAIALAASAPLSLSVSHASTLSVIPISVEVVQPGTTGTLTLRNREARPLNVQVRVFRWTQVDGEDKLEPTHDVVASPPIVSVNAGADYVVRLQRVTGAEATGEEAYRTVVDELPNPNRQRNGSIAIVMRYLVPTYFLSPEASQPKVVWSLVHKGRTTLLNAVNSGDKRIQIIDLKLRTGNGRLVVIGKGLAGYVLGRSSRTWALPAKIGAADGGFVIADSDHGPIQARLSH
jgi:fimbrial chaperone protein